VHVRACLPIEPQDEYPRELPLTRDDLDRTAREAKAAALIWILRGADGRFLALVAEEDARLAELPGDLGSRVEIVRVRRRIHAPLVLKRLLPALWVDALEPLARVLELALGCVRMRAPLPVERF
jgi:hypothetical protein